MVSTEGARYASSLHGTVTTLLHCSDQSAVRHAHLTESLQLIGRHIRLALASMHVSHSIDSKVLLQLRKERDRLRYKMDMFKKTLSSELVTMQLRGSNGPGSG